MCAITGRSSTGTIGLLISYVSGRRRVPSPAARTIALIAPARYRIDSVPVMIRRVPSPAARTIALIAPARYRIDSVPVMVRLVRPLDGHADVGGLRVAELRETRPERI